jgi:hypothetical protein
MQTFAFSRFALRIVAATVLLAACGRSSVPIATGNTTPDASVPKHSKTFDYTGKEQAFIVPAGVRRLTVIAHGGQGGNGGARPTCYHPPSVDTVPGFPGRVYAVIRVRPGEKLYVLVGGSGGFNGGGPGGTAGYGSCKGQNGGGASDVRIGGDALKDRIIVAAGGGGGGESLAVFTGYAPGGNGGGLAGQSGGSDGYSIDGGGGGGGEQSDGGAGGVGGLGSQSSAGNGNPGGHGKFGAGGAGGNGGPGPQYYGGLPGGGGGGGYYGGGGGGGGASYNRYNYDDSASGGGGGGSSYVEPSAITSRMWTGWRSKGDGRVIFSWN